MYMCVHVREWWFYLQDCCMILYHPYRALLQYLADLEKDKDETFFKLSW